jgi:transglutaminase-like putative cysteine protease
MNSGVINYCIIGKMDGNLLRITTGTGRRGKVKEIKLNEVPVISGSIDHMLRNIKPVPGASINLTFFDPATMTQKQAIFKVISKEKIRINSIEYDTFRLEGDVMGARLNFWIDMNGDILKEQSIMGLTMVKSSPANAPLNIENGAEDFYEVTAVRTDKKLPDTKRLKRLKIRLKGIEETGFDLADISNERQQYINGILTVTLEQWPFRSDYKIPYEGGDPEIKKYLAPEYNIESDVDLIIGKAQKIAGNIKDPVTISKRMMEWVYTSIEKRPEISIPSAAEVLETMTGDCNEHATLLTALLRAVGIPARISTGLVYTRENFYYHAWVEAYTGEWITIDPTMNQFPADVSHITLIRGNIDKQVEIMGVIGKLAIEVIDFEYY